MLATTPEFRDVDFSHLRINGTSPESMPSPQSPLLLFTLLFSALLHWLFLLVTWDAPKMELKVNSASILRINLVQQPVKQREVKPQIITEAINELQVTQEVHKKITAPPVQTTSNVPAKKSRTVPPARGAVIEPLTSEELAEITNDHDAQSNLTATNAIAENVFHPGLRAQLNFEVNKPKLARSEDSTLAAYIDPAGATRMQSTDGGCLLSPAEMKIGTPKNWYMTSCGGESESERMMERINERVRAKLRFEDRN